MDAVSDAIKAQLRQAAEELVERQRTAHERVACPRCGAAVGKRCHKLNSKPFRSADPGLRGLVPAIECKHPHAERLRADGISVR